MRSHNDSIDTTHTPPPLSFYNTFKITFYPPAIMECRLCLWANLWLAQADSAMLMALKLWTEMENSGTVPLAE